ncbi:MAG: hypothetical protein IJ092_05680 [Atopobiaceae bacterium]|nr:hypothetical protein [Atopobiaceae bacterium]MBR1830665.1 hypothetical protein [Atopobiaceae bacterium]
MRRETSRGDVDGHRAERGQATVEYALVLFAFLASIVAMGTLWHTAREGALVRLCTEKASHGMSGEGAFGSAQDILLY